MKIILSLILLCANVLFACTSEANRSPSTSSSPSTPSPVDSPTAIASIPPKSPLTVEPFTLDELNQQGGGGCGMTLWRASNDLRPTGYLFYNRFAQKADDEFTLMRINGQFVRFRRSAATGQEFYGQQTSQTFISQDKATQLQVDVEPGQPGEIESIAVKGTLQVNHQGNILNIPVRGDAGC